MDNQLRRAHERAEQIRFVGDIPRTGLNNDARTGVMGSHGRLYQDAIEISEALTPLLWERLENVIQRLGLPSEVVSAFIYSSPNVQAECISGPGGSCIVRFSSGLD